MRQYISSSCPDKDGLLTISEKDFRYLRNVLRLKIGDMIHARLPNDELRAMTVCKIDDKSRKIVMQVCGPENSSQKGENQPEETASIENSEFFLFMSVPKSSKFDLIVRQAAECGISKIIPVQTEFSQKGSEKMNFRSERFERIIKEARQQSGSPVSTKITECKNLAGAAEFWKNESGNLSENEKIAFVLYERNRSTSSIAEIFDKIRSEKNPPHLRKIALFCGSEGGFSPNEIKFLKESGFVPVHLKTNILRCETAALYGIAAVQSLL